jgi:hypothetical protein
MQFLKQRFLVPLAVIISVAASACSVADSPNEAIHDIRAGLQLALSGEQRALHGVDLTSAGARSGPGVLVGGAADMSAGYDIAHESLYAMRGMHRDSCGDALDGAVQDLGDAANAVEWASRSISDDATDSNSSVLSGIRSDLARADRALGEAEVALPCVEDGHAEEERRRQDAG